MANTDQGMRDYYQARVPVYEQVYAYPERQADLRWLEAYVPEQLAGCNVLEVAAGTGYWTRQIAREAAAVTATDVNVAALELLREADLPDSVQTQVVDAYRLESLAPTSAKALDEATGAAFDAAFAGLWFSHVEIAQRGAFLDSLHSVLRPGSTVIFVDNSAAQCQRLPISHRDAAGNTYQDRQTVDGQTHRILKNFPAEEALRNLVEHVAVEVRFKALDNYWLFQYRLGSH